ncbi:MAG: Rrf2 family transcriptional regulator [Gammaproteobacteria bacterium]|nr:Rrf2 family transcriptional regulator [Gammaproteobacteria bacterium]
MRLTTKGRYAVTAMIELSINQLKGPVTLKSISDSQGISLSYLEQLFSKMKKSNLVTGTRGPGGGYRLARDVDLISIADIVVAVDEPLDITECEGKQNCHDGKRCLTHGLWSELSDQLYNFLAGIRLGELMRESGIGETGAMVSMGTHRVDVPRIHPQADKLTN